MIFRFETTQKLGSCIFLVLIHLFRSRIHVDISYALEIPLYDHAARLDAFWCRHYDGCYAGCFRPTNTIRIGSNLRLTCKRVFLFFTGFKKKKKKSYYDQQFSSRLFFEFQGLLLVVPAFICIGLAQTSPVLIIGVFIYSLCKYFHRTYFNARRHYDVIVNYYILQLHPS